MRGAIASRTLFNQARLPDVKLGAEPQTEVRLLTRLRRQLEQNGMLAERDASIGVAYLPSRQPGLPEQPFRLNLLRLQQIGDEAGPARIDGRLSSHGFGPILYAQEIPRAVIPHFRWSLK